VYASGRVLIYGSDAMLLKTRCLILESMGCQATMTMDGTIAASQIFSEEFDLFVLCRTLDSEKREVALAIAHEYQPNMKNLILSDNLGIRSLNSQDTIIDGFVAPEALVAVAMDLIRSAHLNRTEATHVPAVPSVL
jgi:hypothetical protein